MDRGAWSCFVDGVTCLVNSVSVCEERREERREKMKDKIKGSRENAERSRRKEVNKFEKCFRTLKSVR